MRKPENLRVLYARLIEFFGSAFAGCEKKTVESEWSREKDTGSAISVLLQIAS